MVEVFRKCCKTYKNTIKSLLRVFQSHPVVPENCEKINFVAMFTKRNMNHIIFRIYSKPQVTALQLFLLYLL